MGKCRKSKSKITFVSTIFAFALVISMCATNFASAQTIASPSGFGCDQPAMMAMSMDGVIPLDPRESGCLAPEPDPEDVSIDKEQLIHLEADKNSAIILDNVEMEITSEGKYYVRVSGTRDANEILEEYDLHIDYDNKTYTAEKTTNDEYSYTSNIPGFEIDTVATHNYIATVTARTMDPAVVELTKTTLSLGWKDTNGSLSYNSRNLSTWAANPSALGTHWYLLSAQYGNDPNTYQSATAKYVNYDFLSGLSGPTYASTYIYIGANKGGRYTYYADLTTSGVAGHLLWIRVSTN